MISMNYTLFLAGISMAAFGASGLFFLKLWKGAQDRFFAFFAVACALLSIERVVALFVQGVLDPNAAPLPESTSWIYLIRLLAFMMIVVAIVGKNMHRK
jgi:hypothetical protein